MEIQEVYHFSVYNHQLVIGADRLISRKFIVLRNSTRDIVKFTNWHIYIHSKNQRQAKSISDDGNNRFDFVVCFLNYVIIEKYSEFKIDRLTDIPVEAVQQFFYWYGEQDEKKHTRTKSTVERCMICVFDFLRNVIKKNKLHCRMRLDDLVEEYTYRTRRGYQKKSYRPLLDIRYRNLERTIFRDMPNSVFNILLAHIMENHIDILMLVALSAFAGLRPSEACNVRQEISPLGSGIRMIKRNGVVTQIEIDLREEKVLRSDLKPVGWIKKERVQRVYPRFLNAFLYCYEQYLKYLSGAKFESQYCPLTVSKHGNAMTYATYWKRFKNIVCEIIPILLDSDDIEVAEYGHLLLTHSIAPHIFRHWFSVRLTLYGEDVAGLQYWRGDKSPESALRYLQNKGELMKQLQRVADRSFDYLLDVARKEITDEE